MTCFKFFVVFALLLLCLLEPNFAEDAQIPLKGLQRPPTGLQRRSPIGLQRPPNGRQRPPTGLQKRPPMGLQGLPPYGLQRPLTGLQRRSPIGLQRPPNGLQRPPTGLQRRSPIGLQRPPNGLQWPPTGLQRRSPISLQRPPNGLQRSLSAGPECPECLQSGLSLKGEIEKEARYLNTRGKSSLFSMLEKRLKLKNED